MYYKIMRLSWISPFCPFNTHIYSFLRTSEMKLLYWFSMGGLLVLVVGDGGVLEYKPVLFVCSQRQSFGPNREKQ